MDRAIACLTAKEREHYEMICTSKNRFNDEVIKHEMKRKVFSILKQAVAHGNQSLRMEQD
jgi:hypothetical protein